MQIIKSLKNKLGLAVTLKETLGDFINSRRCNSFLMLGITVYLILGDGICTDFFTVREKYRIWEIS